MAYQVYKYGQITKFEAGTIYRAMKQGDIEVLPETTKTLYDRVNYDIRLANERYNQDHLSYDLIYKATEAILNNNKEEAQSLLKNWEEREIKAAGKKSPFHKYQGAK